MHAGRQALDYPGDLLDSHTSPVRKDESSLTTADGQNRIAVLYSRFGSVLCGLMENRFGIAPEDSESLLHDIFASLMRTQVAIENEEKWLIGAACNASRTFRRQQWENVDLTDDLVVASTDETDLALGQILEKLPSRARDVLRLRYLEGLSGNEIAERYGTSPEYTHVLIHRSLEKARAVAREGQR